jgi:gluconate 2-dehydrogenase gamma chain
MSDLTRREVLRQLALAIAAAGVVDRVAAQEVHHMAGQAMAASGGAYRPTALSVQEYAALERLTDLIIPVEKGAPGAVQAGVAAWIDMLVGANDQLKTIYGEGLAWLDATMKTRGAADFVSATVEQQTGLLDLIAYRRNQSTELAPGIQFFVWARRMTVDGFYTSQIGMRDIYLGNSPQATFTVPAESLEYALKKSGL